jgi:arylsulfatase A-like enzyme
MRDEKMPHQNNNRRQFLKNSAGVLASTSLLSSCSHPQPQNKQARPNIIVILVDDLGYGDLSSYGSPYIQTPNIDRIVEGGMKFTNGYANCPVCSPTRAALLSGRYQEMVGVPGVIRTHAENSWGFLSPDSKLIQEILQPAGYHTALIGKWHLGLESPNHPLQRGFDHFHGFLGDMMDDYYTHRRHGINYMERNGQEIDPQGHATDLFTQYACEYIRSPKDNKPFFLYLAYNAPHVPVQPPQEWLTRFTARHPEIDQHTAKLAAFIEHLDAGIGRVMQCLETNGLDQNTLLLFASDNGGQTNIGANNGHTRDGKGTMYEGGIKVPMAAYWPEKIASNQTTDRIALSMDIFPTIMEACGVPINHEIDSLSFLPTLLGIPQPAPKRDLFFGRREGGKYQGKTIEAIRRGDWKLLRNMPGAPLELYNLKTDPLEQTNRLTTEPAIANELEAALNAQLATYAKIPWQKP